MHTHTRLYAGSGGPVTCLLSVRAGPRPGRGAARSRVERPRRFSDHAQSAYCADRSPGPPRPRTAPERPTAHAPGTLEILAYPVDISDRVDIPRDNETPDNRQNKFYGDEKL